MILSGREIARQLELGAIEIDPFDPKRINPASVDLTLGPTVAVYDRFTTKSWTSRQPYDGNDLKYLEQMVLSGKGYGHDTKSQLVVRRYTIDPELGWVLNPGVGYLMHTAERVSTNHFVPIIDGKSSLGRLFIQVHVTAGYGDPGFSGQYTLEVTSKFPVRVYPGMRICQMRFNLINGEITSYQRSGSYTGVRASGPVESHAHVSAFK
jgi:dCTP deaminase